MERFAVGCVAQRLVVATGGGYWQEDGFREEEGMTDKERLDWLEAHYTLHRAVEFLYVVDGYQAQLVHDDNPMGRPAHGETLRDAIDNLAARNSAALGAGDE